MSLFDERAIEAAARHFYGEQFGLIAHFKANVRAGYENGLRENTAKGLAAAVAALDRDQLIAKATAALAGPDDVMAWRNAYFQEQALLGAIYVLTALGLIEP